MAVAIILVNPISVHGLQTSSQRTPTFLNNASSNRTYYATKRRLLHADMENATSTTGDSQIDHRDNFELFATVVGVLGGITLITGVVGFCYSLCKKHKERVEKATEKEAVRRTKEGEFLHNLYKHKQPFHMGSLGSEVVITPIQYATQSSISAPEICLMPLQSEVQTEIETEVENHGQAFNDAIQAVIGGNIELLQQMLINNLDLINQSDTNGDTLLHYAQSSEIAYFLLQHGANPDSVNNQGLKPIHIAAKADNQPVIRVLLDWMEIVTSDDLSALFHIAARSSVSLLRSFVASGLHRRFRFERPPFASMSVNQLSIQTSSGLTLLHEAVIANNPDVVTYILDIGLIDVNATDDHGNTPLHYAASSLEINTLYVGQGQESISTILDILLNNGATLDALNNFGVTPLYKAIVRGNDLTIRALLKSPQWRKTRSNRWEVELLPREIVEHNLVQTFAALTPQTASRLFDINAPDKEGNTALHRACRAGKTEIVKVLLRLETV